VLLLRKPSILIAKDQYLNTTAMRNHKNVNAIKENTLGVISGFRREVAEN